MRGCGVARVCGFGRFLSFRIFYVLPNKLGVVLAKKSRFAKTDEFPFCGAKTRRNTPCHRALPSRAPPSRVAPTHTHTVALRFSWARAREDAILFYFAFLSNFKAAQKSARAHAHARKMRRKHENVTKIIFAPRSAAERTGKRVCGCGAARVCGFGRFLNFRISRKWGRLALFFETHARTHAQQHVRVCIFKRFANNDDFPLCEQKPRSARTNQGGAAPRHTVRRGARPPGPRHTHRARVFCRAALFMGARARGMHLRILMVRAFWGRALF